MSIGNKGQQRRNSPENAELSGKKHPPFVILIWLKVFGEAQMQVALVYTRIPVAIEYSGFYEKASIKMQKGRELIIQKKEERFIKNDS